MKHFEDGFDDLPWDVREAKRERINHFDSGVSSWDVREAKRDRRLSENIEHFSNDGYPDYDELRRTHYEYH